MYIFDIEVFKYDWVVIFKKQNKEDWYVFHNDYLEINSFITQNKDEIFGGFNNKHYDNYILKAIVNDLTPEEVKGINDYIIKESGNGWEHPLLQKTKLNINTCDIRDDMQEGLSLKSIEAHLGMAVVESSVDFNIDRPLTNEELQETIKYCKYDITATERLFDLRKTYLETKETLGTMCGMSKEESLSYTNAKLVAKYLQATRQEHTDRRVYEYPKNLKVDLIPLEIRKFFESITDKRISEEELFKRKLEIVIGDCPCVYGWGGVHGSLTSYSVKETETKKIFNKDVSSLYPSLMIKYNYLSRNILSSDIFEKTYWERIEAKHNGDSKKAKALKLPLNVTSGATEDKFNSLYDPRQARNMRISGQLFLTELVISLINACKTFKIINFNTDGLMYEIDKSEIEKVEMICKDWEQSTQFELETDKIQAVWLKDVNNLLFVDDKGKVKTVGGYLNYGISEKGAWSINNNYTIVKKAIQDYFIKGKDVRETIYESKDILDFQLIAKVSMKFTEPYQVIGLEKVPIQRANRVYATKDKRLGTLFKKHSETNRDFKISELPPHCLIDNDNKATFDDIDREWYVELAQKKIADFTGTNNTKDYSIFDLEKEIKGEESMNIKEMNLYEKLIEARCRFLESGVSKSGVHLKLEFKYFELEDIVPTATKIFKELGLVPIVSFNKELATMTIVNCNNPVERETFSSPMKDVDIIISNTGKAVTNEIQTLGSMETYQRRYLYLMALDIVENDSIDPNTANKPKKKTEDTKVPNIEKSENKSKKTVTIVERKNIQERVVGADNVADPLQIDAIKKALKELLSKDPTKKEFATNLALKTDHFKNLTKTKAEEVIIKISELIGA